ncbi:hypothetical protein T07_14122 [Trichinella nelsoni]|uniref:Uncharacterized protein n=1 Tax=Trichinella nelsoni TaxID=6336 RepID=A0A0V0RKB6_9BILA|nr:hypothetical protein T07_14122 [Trichinella nelsoni]
MIVRSTEFIELIIAYSFCISGQYLKKDKGKSLVILLTYIHQSAYTYLIFDFIDCLVDICQKCLPADVQSFHCILCEWIFTDITFLQLLVDSFQFVHIQFVIFNRTVKIKQTLQGLFQ